MPQLPALASCFLKCFKSLVFQMKIHSELPWDERSLISCIMSQQRRNSQKAPYCPCLWISRHSSYEEEERTMTAVAVTLCKECSISFALCTSSFPWYCSWCSPLLCMTEDTSPLNLTSTFFLSTTERAGCGRCLSCPKQTEPTPSPSSRRCSNQTNKMKVASFWQRGRL